ncbi:MAG: PAS domain S-box protein [Bacteroidetes bacterium]|nr:PAS domain S-box protein [Bacteroidota bacterium]
MENKLNKLLLRQIKKHFGSMENIPEELKSMILDVNSTYENFESDTQLLQNSIEISSQELRDAFQKHKQDAEAQNETINKIKKAIFALNPAGQSGIAESVSAQSDSSYLFDSLIKLIEDRNQAEEEILKLSKAVEQNPASIVITDINGDIEYVNPKFCDLTGYTKEEAIGKNPRILKSETTPREFFTNLWGTILSGKEWSGELQNRKKNGELYWESALISPIISENKRITHFIAIKEDITERKRAEAERIRQSGLITSLLDSIPDIIFFKDTEGVYLGCNLPFAEFVGKSKNEIIGKTDFDLFDHETAIEFRHYDKLMLKQKLPRHNEEWITYPNGKKVLIDTLKTPYWAGDGSLIGILGISRDITKRKQTEEVLFNERTLFRTIIDLIPDAVYVKDLNGRKIIANPKEVLFAGKNSENEVIGKTDYQLHPGIEAKRAQDEDHFVLHSGKPLFNIDGTLIDNNGKFHWLLCSKVPLRDVHGKITGLVGVTHDITERKRAEEALSQAAERLSIATKAGGVGIWDYDILHNNLFWDDQMYHLYGVTKDSTIGPDETRQSGIHPDDLMQSEAEIRLAISGKKEFNTEFRVVWPDGSVHNVRALAYVVRDERGKPMRMIGTNWDITEQKNTEATLLKAKQEADIASNAKSEFLANMSHEIRTPLNGVIGFTDLLLKTPLNKIQKQYTENVNISGHALLSIISDILDFSKIEAGKMELDHIKTDMIELAEQTSDIIKYHAAQKGLELLLDIQPDMPRFAMVEVNLLGNAVKFTASGEVELRVTFEKNNDISGKFSFSVRDTGIGINQEQQKKLFNAFTQADSSTTRKFGGTGLGLTISNMLAEKMGGKIEIISETGLGSNFFFTLEADYENGEKPDTVTLTGINRILVIDDNENNRMILEHTLLSWGIEFVGIDNGLSALKLLEISQPFDVIIVDYHMPFLNGIDTIRMIREQLNLSPEQQPTILLHSSSDDIGIYDECKKLGVRFNLTKPVKSQELLHYLQSIHSQPVNLLTNDAKPLPENTSGLEKLASKVILVAEDVTMNMLLVTTIIKQMIPNITVLEAKNGKEALEMTISKIPDLILMDVQMPEMSGIEATVSIRTHEKTGVVRIPIVALTAGAVKGEKEKCLDAGMDDFLTKPIDRNALKKVLVTYLTTSNAQSDISGDEISPHSSNLHFDEKMLMKNIGQSQVILEELLEVAPIQISFDLESLKKGIRETNLQEIKRSAHSIRGASSNMCFHGLANLAKDLELNVGEGMGKIDLIFNEMQAEWEQVQLLLKTTKL